MKYLKLHSINKSLRLARYFTHTAMAIYFLIVYVTCVNHAGITYGENA